MTSEVVADPDCQAGKHEACSGLGLDVKADKVVSCPCWCHEEKCRHCGGYVDSMNSDALAVLTLKGEQWVWCGEDCLNAWRSEHQGAEEAFRDNW